jgi:hypothetical protein
VTPSAAVEQKARNYLLQGRLVVHTADPQTGRIRASCRGDGAVYTLGRDDDGWYCNCPARTRCAHMVALGLVTAPEPV